jgi:uncharacterized membrane protein (Fun14 family)
VSLTILEAFLKDHSSVYALAGNLASDLIQIGISSVMGGIAGLAIGAFTTLVLAQIGFAIVISVGAGFGLSHIDNKYQLTKKLSVLLEKMSDQFANSIKNGVDEVQRSSYRGLGGFLRSQGYKGPF